MGQTISTILRRNDESVQEVAIANSNAYKWPPKTGNYFGSHFIMGGERFDSQQPEAFLFGENSDLNFLGNRPMPFPYPAPQLNEPTRTLRSLVNIRKDTIRLVRCGTADKTDVNDVSDVADDDEKVCSQPPADDLDVEAGGDKEPVRETDGEPKYNIEFTFDSDVVCNISIMYMAKEEMVNGVVTYTPRDASMNSDSYTYKRGASQTFTQAAHILDPSRYTENEWTYDMEKEEIPIVIHCTVEKETEHAGHSHVTFCVLERLSDGFTIKSIKQKQCVDGLLYILQEFYGIENKENEHSKGDAAEEDDYEDNTAECVICMSDIRDTLILPCRHLCLCNGCADSLRYQANNCPICRAPFRALLQLRAIRKKASKPDNTDTNNGSDDDDDTLAVSQKGVPAGYEAISLIEALNGPCFYNNKSLDHKQKLLSSQGSLRRSKKSKKKDKQGSKITLKDKNSKDKDDIVDEEKARDAEAKESEVSKKSEDAADVNSEDPESKQQEKTTTDTDSCDQESQAEQVVRSKTKIQSDSKNKQHTESPKTAESANNQQKDSQSSDAGVKLELDKSSDSLNSAKLSHSSVSGDEEESDTLALSVRTQTTTLPGTPDHVLDDDQETLDHSL